MTFTCEQCHQPYYYPGSAIMLLDGASLPTTCNHCWGMEHGSGADIPTWCAVRTCDVGAYWFPKHVAYLCALHADDVAYGRIRLDAKPTPPLAGQMPLVSDQEDPLADREKIQLGDYHYFNAVSA